MSEMTGVDWTVIGLGIGLVLTLLDGRKPHACRHRWSRVHELDLRGYYQKCHECGEVREVRREER